ncbi:MAG: methyltransferase domain-containing protein [Actinophytocola sp.]|uniref:class I SAM-dependent DNA methyltransferase n=1 Tax=Actinophytocola sp. TaxID=1872138 RepID=UPI001329C670|nr:class I SAM-dependent methyltransferase [Actinophytocola sp.]MPZ83557.1 methyltransferase domain-containing protein [Actinophytocola sp.]
MVDPRTFYGDLAGDYHLMFRDWWASAQHQGDVLGELLRRHGIHPPARVADCTCGIGTQALPLAAQGFRVAGSDLSAAAVARARTEARDRGIELALSVADVRALPPADRPFDAVVSCDNSLPHLLTDADLAAALRSIRGLLDPGGLFLASTRDYDAIVRDQVAGVMPAVHDVDGRRRIVGQAWQWSADHRTVEIHVFCLRREGPEWAAAVRSTTYRALLRDELTAALSTAGFADVRWLFPDESGYYQPVVVAQAR